MNINMWNVKYNLVKKHNFDLIYKINTNLTFSQITVHLYAFWIQKLKNKLYIYYDLSIKYFSWILYIYM